MKRKILSFAVAFVLLLQTFASAGTIHDLLKGNGTTLGDSSDPFYDPAVGIFYWSKFQDTDATKPNGGVVSAQVTGAVKSTGGSEAYAASTTAQNFDYKVSIDMSEVQATYNTLHGYAYAAVSANATLKTAFDDSFVIGNFNITVTYDPAAITAPSGTYPTTVKYVSDDTTATIYTVGTPDFSTPGTIVIPVTANTTVDALYTTPALLNDIYLELSGWTASVQDSIVSATMTGYTMIADNDASYLPADDDYAQIDYASTPSSVIVYEDTSTSSHHSSSGGGKEPTTPSGDDDTTGKAVTPDGDDVEGSTVEKNPDGTAKITVAPGSQKGKGNKKPNGYSPTPYSPADPDYDPDEPQVIDGVEPDEDGNYVIYPRYVTEEVPSKLRRNSDGQEDFEHFAYIVGYPDGEVKPNGNITREEVTAAFYRLLNPEYRATIEATEHNFPDVEAERWSNNSIATMANGGYIVGDTEGNFRPGKPITRAEFAVIASKFIDEDAEIDENFFTDIDGHWAKEYILKVAEEYWISGYENRTFKPDAYITRAEAMTIINRMLVRYGDVDSDYAIQWPDVSKSDWYYQSIIEATTDHKYERKENGWSEKWIEK